MNFPERSSWLIARRCKNLCQFLIHPGICDIVHYQFGLTVYGRVFKESAEEVDLRGHSSVDAEWMAYIGAFRHLRSLNVADCHRLTSSALWAIAGFIDKQQGI